MNRVPGPLEQHLEPPLGEQRVQQVANQLKRARPLPRPVAWRWVIAATAAVIALVAAWQLFTPAEPEQLELASGATLPTELTARVALSDGSFVTLDPGAKAQVVANQPDRLTLLLKSGGVRFEVKPGGRRRWLIEAGVASVEVVGTIFSVHRSTAGVSVSVERGTVLVRSDQLPDRLVRLDAGHFVFARARGDEPAKPAPAPVEAERPVTPPPHAPPPKPSPVPPPDWRTPASSGDFEAAWAALGEPGFRARVAASRDPEELLLLSDLARATQHWAPAAAALSRLLEVSPGDPSAAFMLGRLELEQLSRPAEAAKHFAGVSGPLAGDARVREVEALAAAGQLDLAIAAAHAALEKSEDGRLRRWLDDPQHAAQWLH